jgi:N-acetylneuraminic acid mutarotase
MKTKLYHLLICTGIVLVNFFSVNAVYVWTQKANFGGAARQYTIGFSIGTKGYLGLGVSAVSPYTYYSDLWEWDQGTNTWTQKANYPGSGPMDGIAFSIGTKGYIGTGACNGIMYADLWEWDQGTNTWTQKANFPGAARYDECAFVGIGSSGGPPYFNDFYSYNPSTNTWTAIANYPLNISARAAFSIGSKGYICNGWTGTSNLVSLYAYDTLTGSWTLEANYGGVKRSANQGFTINGKAYVGIGRDYPTYYSDFWEYNPVTNSWTPIANFGGGDRAYTAGFSIGNYGYCGTGVDGSGNVYQDFWQYGPNGEGVNEINLDNSFSVYPNPASSNISIEAPQNATLEILDMQGQLIKTLETNSNKTTIDVSLFPNGVYFVKVEMGKEEVIKEVIKN